LREAARQVHRRCGVVQKREEARDTTDIALICLQNHEWTAFEYLRAAEETEHYQERLEAIIGSITVGLHL
jgi:hypothetical protein